MLSLIRLVVPDPDGCLWSRWLSLMQAVVPHPDGCSRSRWLSLIWKIAPDEWKTSCGILCPRRSIPAHTATVDQWPRGHVMKSLERLVLWYLHAAVGSFLDPLEFVYQPQVGVEDAMISLHPPGGGNKHCESQVLWLLQVDLIFSTGSCWTCRWRLHSRPGSTATSQDGRSMRGWETSEGWGATGDRPVSLPVYFLYLRLQVLFAVLPPADTLGSLCYWTLS